MSIDTTCTGCGRKLRVADEHAGKQARCPICGAIYTVPANEGRTVVSAETSTPFPDHDRQTGGVSLGKPATTPQADTSETITSGASSSEASWHMKTPEGPIYGPVEKPELDRWVSEGRIAADCYLRCGDQDWRAAAEVYPFLSPLHTGSGSPAGYTSARRSSFENAPAAPAAPNPFADRGHRPSAPAGYARSSYLHPHRGGLILTLGIIGWLFCPIPSFMAWVMGAHDLREMREGRMDPSGASLTQAGQILGMIISILWMVMAVIFVFFFLVAVAAG